MLNADILCYSLVPVLSKHLWATNHGMVEIVPFESDSDSSGDDDIAELETSCGDDDIEGEAAMAAVDKAIYQEFDINAAM